MSKSFFKNLVVGDLGLDADALRQTAEADPKGFVEKTDRLIAEGKLSWNKVRDLPKLFHALSQVQVPVHIPVAGQMRAISASAFPLLSGNLTVAALNEAYDAVPTIGQELVTDRDDPKKVTTIAGVLSQNVDVDRVDELKDYPEIGASEERYDILHKRNGRRLSISAEAIEENDVAGIVDRINALGEIAAETIEEQTLRRVCDIDGSGTTPAEPYVLRRNGSGLALYQTDNDPLDRLPTAAQSIAGVAGNRYPTNPLTSTTNLDNARKQLASMKNSRGKKIAIPRSMQTLLVPESLLSTAFKLTESEMEPGVANEKNAFGPSGLFRFRRILSSPKLDDLSTTVWYLGCFEKQFVRKHKLRLEFVSLGGDTESFLRSRVAAQFRVGWDVEIGARDYVYVVQNLSATTAP